MRVLHLLKTSIGASWALCQTRELVNQGVEAHVALRLYRWARRVARLAR